MCAGLGFELLGIWLSETHTRPFTSHGATRTDDGDDDDDDDDDDDNDDDQTLHVFKIEDNVL